MTWSELVERAFRENAEEQITAFLLREGPTVCGNDAARWRSLFTTCEGWRDAFQLWGEHAFVSGVHGWNLYMNVCRLRPPEEQPPDWTRYLHRMTLMMVVCGLEPAERNSMATWEYGRFDAIGAFYCAGPEYGGYESLTGEQWLREAGGLLEQSWRRYRNFPGNSSRYQRTMEEHYPRLEAALDYLSEHTGTCDVVRMHRHGGDETVWYFARAQDCVYIMYISDSM